jgi:predicted acyl esterase
MSRRLLSVFILLLVISCRTQPEPYKKIDAMIPMREGVHLNTEIYIPKNAAER